MKNPNKSFSRPISKLNQGTVPVMIILSPAWSETKCGLNLSKWCPFSRQNLHFRSIDKEMEGMTLNLTFIRI